MPIKLANNASGTLATAISASDTGIVLTTGDGAEFPTLGAGDYFYATITSTQGTQEIVKATARSGDSLTVVRAQEGTSAAGFAAGARFELRVTAQSVFDAVGDVVASQVGFTPTGGIAATDVQAALAEVDSEKIAFTRLDDNDGSSLVGFLQAGTGAVTRTVQSRLRDVVSVKDFGIAGAELVSSLTQMWPSQDGGVFNAVGYHSAGDEGGGVFIWNASSTATHDGGAVIKPTANSGAGRWLRVFPEDGTITFEMWGAQKLANLTDTGYDSTSAINACLAFLPGPSVTASNWKTPRLVRINGTYGISDTINFLTLHGITFSGVNTMAYQSSGFRWLGTPDPTKAFCFVQGCRSCTFENLRGVANLTNSTTTCQKAFWELSGTITDSIQERCVWRNIMAGERDAYERGGPVPLPSPLTGNYQFKYMFLGSGNNTNNDFHTFEFIRCQTVEWPFWNPSSNFVDWVIRDSRFHYCDHIAYQQTNKIRFERVEGNHIQDTVFLLGNAPGVIPDFVLDGFLSESTFGNLITADTVAQIVIKNCGIDCCYDAAFPYVIDIRGNNIVYLEIDNCRFYTAQGIRQYTIAAAASGGTAKTIVVRGSTTLNYDLSGGNAAARIYVEELPSAIRSGGGLTDTLYRPTTNLLSPASDATYDRLRYDIPQPQVRMGNRFVGGSTTVQHVTYDSGTISSGATYTFTNAIPANCILLGVTAQNRAGFPAVTGYQIGVSGTAAKFGTKGAAADGTTPSANSINNYTGSGPEYSKAATDIILTATGANFAGGRCILTVHYITLDARFYNPDNAQ